MKAKVSNFILLAFTSLLVLSCLQKDEKIAGVKHFYVEFVDQIQSEKSQNIIKDVSSILPEYDYLISEESAENGWPFYGNVKRESVVLKSEMMPPHTNVNRLSMIGQLSTYNMDEHTMKALFTITSKNDSIISIIKESFEWSDGEWHKFSKKLTTDFDIKNNHNQELNDKISKTLIRYTFK